MFIIIGMGLPTHNFMFDCIGIDKLIELNFLFQLNLIEIEWNCVKIEFEMKIYRQTSFFFVL